jgi:hypothetical protein
MNNPPSTNRGVTDPFSSQKQLPVVSIDWLQYSVAWPDGIHQWPDHGFAETQIIKQVFPPHDKLYLTGEIVNPIRGYNNGQQASFGRVFWHSTNRAQHIGVIFTGDDMRAAVNVLMPNMQLLNWALAKSKKISRLDVAVDIYDKRADPSDVLTMWKSGDVGTPARTVTETTSYLHTTDHGIVKTPTIYVGSRAGDKMLRVYDKGKKEQTNGPWIRAELQTRDDVAGLLAKAIQGNGIPDTGRQAIRAFCHIPSLPWWHDAMSGPAVGIEQVGRRETNTERWVMNVALPACQKLAEQQIEDGILTAYDAIAAAFHELTVAKERQEQW